MTRRPAVTRRRTAVLALTATTAALAMPAFADSTTGVGVALAALGGTRQFAVENVSGAALTAIDLGTGGAQPFRTHVTDSSFTNLTQGYSVSATMTNLYLKTGATTYDYATKVPSSALSLSYPTNPLSGLGLTLPVIPQLSVTGTLASCANLSSTVKTTLGLSSLGAVLNPLTNAPLVALCTALGTGVPVTATVDGVLQTVTPAVTSVLDLPTALTGAVTGSFTNPSFAAGTVGADDPARTGTTPTALRIMTGTPGLSTTLRTALTTALNTALAGVPLTAATGTARATVSELVNALSASATSAVATVGNALNTLTATQQVALLNTLTSTLVAPVLGDLTAVTGQYYGFPSLVATNPSTPVAGNYGGTMTVTFVQS